MNAIDVRALRKSYGPVHALRGIDLSIDGRGQIVGLLGPNGAGKTTLVEILEGLRTASSGTVAVLGLDPGHAPSELRARIGVQLQTTAFVPELTVTETLRLYAALDPRSLSSIERRAFTCRSRRQGKGIGSHAVRWPAPAPGRRTGDVARPLSFIFDEPTSGLDPAARRQIHDILRTLRREGKTILLVSHDLDEVEALADRVLILWAGEIVADGTPLELLARGAGNSTLWVAVSGPVDAVGLVPGATFEGPDGWPFQTRTADPTSAIVGLAESLRASGARLDDLRLKRPTLEDVYLQLVGPAAHASPSPTTSEV